MRKLTFRTENIYCYFENEDGTSYRKVLSPNQLLNKTYDKDIVRICIDKDGVSYEIEDFYYNSEKEVYSFYCKEVI